VKSEKLGKEFRIKKLEVGNWKLEERNWNLEKKLKYCSNSLLEKRVREIEKATRTFLS